MGKAHPFRFGVQVATTGSAEEWAATARRVEELGYSTLVVEDHFNEHLAPIPAMQAAAAATTTLRVGAHVFCNDYKHPVVLAKEIATLDLLTGGRVEFGLGAGWMSSDYAKSGIPKDSAGRRIARMREATAIIKGLWDDGPFSFAGDHYTITDFDGSPKPLQKPCPPFMLGGGGQKVLTFAAQQADIVGLAPRAVTGEVDAESAKTATAAATEEKLGWIRAAAGDRIDDIEINMILFAVMITEDRVGTAELMASMFELSTDEALEVPHVWLGSVDQICHDLVARRERWGVSYYTVPGDSLEAAAPVVARLAGT